MKDADTLFRFCNATVLPGWILLVFAPGWKWSARFIAPFLIPCVLAIVYIGLFISQWGHLEGNFTTLSGVEMLFENRFIVIAGWIHYLAFDLFIGSWEVRDAQRQRIPHLAVVPCLLLTFLFGPVGLLLYLGLRGALRKSPVLQE
jgi:hypothetical protein